METLNCLEVRDLDCRYDSQLVLRGISFKVKPGEAVAIVGPSASGKTTLTYCLSGIIPNRIYGEVSGSIKINGKELLGKPIKEFIEYVGVVLQNYDLQIFGLTVEEDLELSLREKDEDMLRWVLQFFELEKYRHHYVHELSGGLKHRLVIASTILSDPKYIIMDDPVANLDWKSRKIVSKTIELLKEKGKGVIILGRKLKGLENVIDRTLNLSKDYESNDVVKNLQTEAVVSDPQPRTSDPPIVDFRKVYFRYGREFVLKDISLQIKKGEIFAIMGPNGSGKTTLTKHIIGLLKPTMGTVIVDGVDTRSRSPAEMSRYVGMVFQNPEKYFVSETVWDEVAFGVRNLKLDEKNVEEALHILNLLDKKDVSPYSLSMGEKIRLYIGSILAINPEIIILDEPTTGQDEETLIQIRNVVNKLKKMGKTIIIVTHDSDFTVSIADRLAILKDGEIFAEGKPVKLLENQDLVDEVGIEPLSIKGEEKCLAK